MGKIKAKGKAGNAKNFITRTQAVRKLQVSLPDFRRLCIFKGIYPREPRNKRKANKGNSAPNTFYYTKDIQYLLHEPVLAKFREHKAFAKKLAKSLGRREYGDAKRLEETKKPVIRLDHIIKERYPTFTDALRDLDDALSMIHLFANLPSNRNVSPEIVATCEKLCHEFQHYIIRTRALRKSFLSIKGVYYQAEIQGQEIFWLVPYKFAQSVPGDVDFRIMTTFLEFYTKLIGFVLYRLYTSEGLVYPPRYDEDADKNGAGLKAYSLEYKSVGQISQNVVSINTGEAATLPEDVLQTSEVEEPTGASDLDKLSEPATDGIDRFDVAVLKDADVMPQPVGEGDDARGPDLFSNCVFFLNRETPRQSLEFLLRASGCHRIGWDVTLGEGAFTNNSLDPRITHQVVDRPINLTFMESTGENSLQANVASQMVPGRIYVQPQYVWDCINAGKVLRPDAYAPGALLPPHLSPWIKVDKNGYNPYETANEVENVASNDGEMDIDEGSDEEEETEESMEDPTVDVEDSDSEEEIRRQEYQAELEAEARGEAPTAKSSKKRSKPTQNRADRDEEEANEMRKMMMPRKKRKLYEKMITGNKKKMEEANNLRSKRIQLEKQKKARSL